MSNIQTIDPYLSHYVYEKETNPDARLVWRQFKKADVEAVDRLVRIARGERDVIKSQSDWEVFEEILRFYKAKWPQEFKDFSDAVREIRRSRRAGGYSESKGIMHVASFPPRLMRLVKVIFPLQQFDKKFIWKLVRKFRLFKITGEGNMMKGGVQL